MADLKYFSYGYSLGGALAFGLERYFGKDTPVFDGHILMSPNIGVADSLRQPPEKIAEIREIMKDQPGKELFKFNPNPPSYLSDYY